MRRVIPSVPANSIFCTTSAKWRLSRVLDAFERLGGAMARAAAKNYWENPGPESAAEYIRVCIPLYNHHRRGSEMFTRSVMNMEVLLDFPRREQTKFDLLPELRRIKCPTLISAADDWITPLEDSVDIAAALPPGVGRWKYSRMLAMERIATSPIVSSRC